MGYPKYDANTTYADLEKRFTYHPPTDAKVQIHQGIREELLATAESIGILLPEGREKSLFLTKLEEAMFWANAAVAREV
jgi:hypothetical protein